MGDIVRRGDELLSFGSKYPDKTRRWVRTNAPNYARWCRQNANGEAMSEFQEYCKVMDERDFGGPVLLDFGKKYPDKTREWVRKNDPGYCQYCRDIDECRNEAIDDFVAYLDSADDADRAAAITRRTTTPSRRAVAAPPAPGAPTPAARPAARSRSPDGEDSRRTHVRRRLLPAAAEDARPPQAPAHWMCRRHGCHLSKGPLTVGPNGEPHNFGRQFFLCPKKTPDDDCFMQGGFRWADGSLPFSDASFRRAENFHGAPRGSFQTYIHGVGGGGGGGVMRDYADHVDCDANGDDGVSDGHVDQLVCPMCGGGLPGADDRGLGDGTCECHPCQECGEPAQEHELSEEGLCNRCCQDDDSQETRCKRPGCHGELDYFGHFCKKCGEVQGTSDDSADSDSD